MTWRFEALPRLSRSRAARPVEREIAPRWVGLGVGPGSPRDCCAKGRAPHRATPNAPLRVRFAAGGHWQPQGSSNSLRPHQANRHAASAYPKTRGHTPVRRRFGGRRVPCRRAADDRGADGPWQGGMSCYATALNRSQSGSQRQTAGVRRSVAFVRSVGGYCCGNGSRFDLHYPRSGSRCRRVRRVPLPHERRT